MRSSFLNAGRAGRTATLPPRPWPLWARALARRRVAGERGVGDTLARLLNGVGAARAAAVYERLVGKTCGCKDRQQWMNEQWPYVSG